MTTPEPESNPSETPQIPETFFGSLGISSPRRIAIFFLCFAIALALSLWPRLSGNLDPAPARALFILLFASLLWVTEAIPAFAVGILVIGLRVALLGNPAGPFAETAEDWEQFVSVLGHPLVWLFFGGFVLAAGMRQTGLDRSLAVNVLGRLGDRPGRLLFGVMAITFVLSMFISNTATTAMMLAILAPLVASLPKGDAFAKRLLLGLAVAANLGGMGSLIGTPPNAIAVGALTAVHGRSISFLEWLAVGLPPALLLSLFAWLLLAWLHPFEHERVPVSVFDAPANDLPQAPRWQVYVVSFTLVVTVGLWLTSGWHGIPTAAVSFIPTVLLTMTGVLGAAALRNLSWDVLFLLAGGLALGQAVTETGLSARIVEALPVEGMAPMGLALSMAFGAVVLSNFMSNTAAANILVPLGATMAVGFEAQIALPIALVASTAMCLPIATPPNALVFSNGGLESRDFMRIGIPIGLLAPVVAVVWVRVLLDLI